MEAALLPRVLLESPADDEWRGNISPPDHRGRTRGQEGYDKGSADGYKRLFRDPIHYANEKFIFDDRVLDPDRPEYLMYYDTSRGKRLVAFMFVPRKPREEGPQDAPKEA